MNPAEWLARTAREKPNVPAILCGETKKYSYKQFALRAASIGSALREKGFGPGSNIAIYMPNSVEYLPVFYGILYCGAMPVPINSKLHPKEVSWILNHSNSKLAFTMDPAALHNSGDKNNITYVSPDPDNPLSMASCEPMSWPIQLAAEDGAWMFYTSGTTGRPKGAVLSCQNLMAMSLSYLADVDDVSPNDAALYAAPMSHGAGLYNFVHVLRGARHVIPESHSFNPKEILDLAEKLQNISMFAAPTMVKRLVTSARQSQSSGEGIKTLIFGGGPMYVADIKQALEVFGPKLVQIYGQGESPMTISTLSRNDIADNTHPDWENRLTSVGKAHSVAQIKIVDSAGNELGTDEIGEIAVAGPQIMHGYLNDTQANAKAFLGGSLLTGDLGHLDQSGYLHLQDRAKDLIISGGSNIYPREVEETLLNHPDVSEVSVVGMPDPEWGEIVIAFVVTNSTDQPSNESLDEACTSAIARFKKPKRYEFVAELPKNNYGKVLKTELRKRLEAAK